MNSYIMIVLNMLRNTRLSCSLIHGNVIVGITLIRRSTSVILLSNDPMEYLYARNYLECIYDAFKDSLDGTFSKLTQL